MSSVKAYQAKSGTELFLHPTVAMGTGTLNNVAWLNELPDPVSKVVWDNYAAVSIAYAEKLKLKEGDLIEVQAGSTSVTLPVHIQPGLHDEVLVTAVGWGRTAAGKVANGVGVNTYTLLQKASDRWVGTGAVVEVKVLGKKSKLVTTQGHHTMESRKIAIEVSQKDYDKDPGTGVPHPHMWQFWSGHQYNGYKWGMSVDLNTCTGCSACVVACQSENNIPVVGKEYVSQNREMHWIRIDRYYIGQPEDPRSIHMPVMCQHCDNAPCETVCPVAATVHSSEGTNDMAYNRCVGTRYCANNCPYKVRRFNWFNYTKNIEKPMNLGLNPSVTVRVRGVMEKCSFCVQRIHDAKLKARVEQRDLKDGDVKTACQQSCPTDAIQFGNTNQADSVVGKVFREEPRGYFLLEEFHAAPQVRYLTRVRNNDEIAAEGSFKEHAEINIQNPSQEANV